MCIFRKGLKGKMFCANINSNLRHIRTAKVEWDGRKVGFKVDSNFKLEVQLSLTLMLIVGVRFRVRLTIANSTWLLMFLHFMNLEI